MSETERAPTAAKTKGARMGTPENEPAAVQRLLREGRALFWQRFPAPQTAAARRAPLLGAVAPGRVNLIGEHTDYTAGFVFPMAIDFATVCVGSGAVVDVADGAGSRCRIVSVNKASANADAEASIVEFTSGRHMEPLPVEHPDSWSNYVAGVVSEYAKLLPQGRSFSFAAAINGNVPLGSGLSSSAALEVAVATFLEALIAQAYPGPEEGMDPETATFLQSLTKKNKALRCQRAENVYCQSPCGIMDQYVSAAASAGSALLIDCRSLAYESVPMGRTCNGTEGATDPPVFLICNSNVKHSIGGGEYPVRVRQCAEATTALRAHVGDRIATLRDATVEDVEAARRASNEGAAGTALAMSELIYRRAKHVVTENARTLAAKEALIAGDWARFGGLMNASHASMRVDYEVSCAEVDFLAAAAQGFEGVYGSRLTGGGFGGCTVTLVERGRAAHLCDHLRKAYREEWGRECACFESSPGPGARALWIDDD